VSELICGRQAVREALRGRREVGVIWCSRRSRESLDWLPASARVETSEKLDTLAETPDHQGVVAEVSPYPYADASALFARENAFLVALDEVTDPHNLGAVARVAECGGADGLVITKRRSAAVTAAACRTSAGAVEHLPIAQVENLADALLRARRPGLWSYGAAGDAATRYDQADYREGGTVFVLGAEGAGLRPRVRKACDTTVSIPMRGRIDSLNVSTAAAVLIFEAARQRGG
jgi:23S rRNA (guanosine2251-2'-O)-methyltransferase